MKILTKKGNCKQASNKNYKKSLKLYKSKNSWMNDSEYSPWKITKKLPKQHDKKKSWKKWDEIFSVNLEDNFIPTFILMQNKKKM